jgi:hypothetical protein
MRMEPLRRCSEHSICIERADMREQQPGVEEVRAHISERYPMYVANPGFEEWLLHRTGADLGRIEGYLSLLDDYGYITGDGTLANDYRNVPDPEHVVEDIERRLATLSPATRSLLRRAAVQGSRFSLALAAAIDGAEGFGEGERLLDEAIAAGVVARDEQYDASLPSLSHRYRFLPQRVGKLLYDELSDEERVGFHAALVELLSAEAMRAVEPGARDMLAAMISEHNNRFARPNPSPTKE